MSHKEQIINAVEKEIKICKRLFKMLPEDSYDYKPAEGMRTTLELLKYLTWTASSVVEDYIKSGERDSDIYRKYVKEAEKMKPEDFPKKMDKQLEIIKKFLAKVTDEDLLTREVLVPWEESMPLGDALIETCVKWLAGYKVQLFLYAKMSGAKELHTGDCWIIT